MTKIYCPKCGKKIYAEEGEQVICIGCGTIIKLGITKTHEGK